MSVPAIPQLGGSCPYRREDATVLVGGRTSGLCRLPVPPGGWTRGLGEADSFLTYECANSRRKISRGYRVMGAHAPEVACQRLAGHDRPTKIQIAQRVDLCYTQGLVKKSRIVLYEGVAAWRFGASASVETLFARSAIRTISGFSVQRRPYIRIEMRHLLRIS